ncbi:hypothetical protein MY10362_006036 [Beauveria mimosiformis]
MEELVPAALVLDLLAWAAAVFPPLSSAVSGLTSFSILLPFSPSSPPLGPALSCIFMPNTPAGPAAHLYAAVAATIQVPPPSAPSLRPLAQTPVRRIAASGAPPVAIHGPSLAHLNPTRHHPCPPQRATAPALQPAKASFVWPCLSATRPTRRRSALRFLFFSTFNSNHERLVSCSVWFLLPSRAIHRF